MPSFTFLGGYIEKENSSMLLVYKLLMLKKSNDNVKLCEI